MPTRSTRRRTEARRKRAEKRGFMRAPRLTLGTLELRLIGRAHAAGERQHALDREALEVLLGVLGRQLLGLLLGDLRLRLRLRAGRLAAVRVRAGAGTAYAALSAPHHAGAHAGAHAHALGTVAPAHAHPYAATHPGAVSERHAREPGDQHHCQRHTENPSHGVSSFGFPGVASRVPRRWARERKRGRGLRGNGNFGRRGGSTIMSIRPDGSVETL